MLPRNLGTLVSTVAFCAALAAAPAAGETPRLGSYTIDADGISVSGVSSGGYMAQQFHVAHSATIAGAGILAAGPYRCAGGGYPLSLYRALIVCMDPGLLIPFHGPPLAEDSIAETREQAIDGAIDDPTAMRGDRVYLFSGRLDETVPQSVTDALKAYYEAFVDPEDIQYVENIRAGHAMVTDGFGNACATTESPYINDCGYDTAGELLEAIYGVLAPPVDADGTLAAFDQTEFMADPDDLSMSHVGHLYVPKACAAGAVCRLHVAFHGCQQYEGAIGDAFYAHAGYNRWAEANDIIVLYPQTAPKTTTLFGLDLPWPNPKGCWDWWGYTGGDYAEKTGGQIAAVKAMIDRLTGR